MVASFPTNLFRVLEAMTQLTAPLCQLPRQGDHVSLQILAVFGHRGCWELGSSLRTAVIEVASFFMPPGISIFYSAW